MPSYHYRLACGGALHRRRSWAACRALLAENGIVLVSMPKALLQEGQRWQQGPVWVLRYRRRTKLGNRRIFLPVQTRIGDTECLLPPPQKLPTLKKGKTCT